MKFFKDNDFYAIIALNSPWLLVAVFLLQGLSVAVELATAVLVAERISGSENGLLASLFPEMAPNNFLVLVGTSILFAFFVRVASVHFEKGISQSYRARIADRVVTGFKRKNFRQLLDKNHSEFTKSLTSELDLVIGYVVESMISLGGALVSIAIIAIALCIYSFSTSVIAFAGISLYFVTASFLTKRLQRKYGSLVERSVMSRQLNAQELFSDVRQFKIRELDSKVVSEIRCVNSEMATSITWSNTLTQIPRIALESLLVMVILYTTQSGSGSDGGEVPASLIVFGLAALRMLPSVQKVYLSASNMNFSKRIVDGYVEIMFDNPEPEPPGAIAAPVEFASLAVTDLVFPVYDGSREVSVGEFEIKRGEIVAIIGPSGSGKTTFVDVLAGLHEPNSGIFWLNGEQRNQDALSKISYGYVTQRASLKSGTLEEILSESGFDPLEFTDLVERFELSDVSLTQQIGENARNLSGGQIQRINLLKNLMSNEDIKIFDESFNAISLAQRGRIFSEMRAYVNGLTGLVITHDMDIAKRCDRTYKVEGDQIVELK